MDDVGSLLNHTHVTPLRVVGKEMHNISSGDYWRPRVVLKVVMWSSGSFKPSNDLSCGRWNFEGIGHSSTLVMKGESVLLTIPSKFWSVFSLITLLSSSISLLISLRRSEFASSRVFGRQSSFLLWLPSSSFQLVPERLSSCWSCNLISWFCLVHFSTLAMSVWIYRVSAGESWGVLDSIWTLEFEQNYAFRFEYEIVVSHRRCQTDDVEIVSWLSLSR